MTTTKKKAKPMFSLKTYLLKKAQKKLAKLEFRAEKREVKKPGKKHVHTHDHAHEHDHEHEHAEAATPESVFFETPAEQVAELFDEQTLEDPEANEVLGEAQ
jgi:ABC-type Zn2+ transport system substrate-binding protein/surface adhesin